MSVSQQDSTLNWGQTYRLQRKQHWQSSAILCACIATFSFYPWVIHEFANDTSHGSDGSLTTTCPSCVCKVQWASLIPQTTRFYVRTSRTSILSRNKSKIHKINTYKLPITMAPVISPFSSPPLLITNRHLCCTGVPESHQIISNHTMGHSNEVPSPDLHWGGCG